MDNSNLFYRLRSLDRLLGKNWQENEGKDGELEKQEIYFASPNELNDPMEGFSNIVFKGDEIVWHNFFKHYLMCLERMYNIYGLCNKWSEQLSFDLNYMPIYDTFDNFPSPIYKKLFDDIYQDFKSYFNKEINTIASRTTPITKNELYLYLRAVHFIALAHINKHYIKNGFRQDDNIDYLKMVEFYKENIIPLVESWERSIIEDGQDTDKILNEMCIQAKFINNRSSQNNFDNLAKNCKILMYDLPSLYLDHLDNLIYPKCRIACFMETYHNSSVWGHYADGHKGVCLIFKISANEINLIDSDNKNVSISFQKVNYGAEFETINFFENLGQLTLPQISSWYLGENGRKSLVMDKIFINEYKWRKEYWKRSQNRLLTKTKDWEYEQEYRLICKNSSKKQENLFKYNFNDLEGIIFGMKMPQDARKTIINIIKRKCKENNRDNFNFYQADYCTTNKRMKYRLYYKHSHK